MAENQVSFKFTLEQSVTMHANGVVGKVTGMMLDRDEIRWFLVQYADASKQIHEGWIRERDFAAA